jgi:hypothetical protein
VSGPFTPRRWLAHLTAAARVASDLLAEASRGTVRHFADGGAPSPATSRRASARRRPPFTSPRPRRRGGLGA